jgi:diguanylate cyclase (GGDEF)-like protein
MTPRLPFPRRSQSQPAGGGLRQGMGTGLADVDAMADALDEAQRMLADALICLAEAEETLRAIGAGEVDAFVVSDGADSQRVFTLSTADRPYRVFVENMREGAATVSLSGIILYANRRLAELLSCPRESLVGLPLATFGGGADPIDLHEVRGPSGLGATVELDLVDSAGLVVPVLVGSSPLDADGEGLTCLTFTDLRAQRTQDRVIAQLSMDQAERMTDLQDAQAALTMQATHDALTGLPNRALVVDRIDQALAHAQRTNRRTVVLFVDLDSFKSINDSYGHAAGDAALRIAADRLAASLRPMDTIARIGGDEFVVLAPDVDNNFDVVGLGKRLVAGLSDMGDELDPATPLSGSVGIAISTEGRGTAEILIKEADTAMYHAKSLGGGRVETFDAALGRRVEQRSAAQRMLQAAIDDHRVVVRYQPIVDLATGVVSGLEALARISQHDGSMLLPPSFIAVAEESGLINPLGAQVLRLACEATAEWQRARVEERLTIAVNVSVRQLGPGDLTMLVQSSLEESGLDATCLSLELTETAVFDLRPDILNQLGQIRDLGVEIGLDDFGTGYASLTHLRRLPLSFVKIDRSFVQRLLTDKEDEGIVAAVVDLAANLGLRSVAEGIETTEQLLRLQQIGCNQGQGYLFARPLPPQEVPSAIARTDW